MEKNFTYLQQIPLFAELSAAELAVIEQITIERNYRKQMFIFVEGEPGEAVYFIKHGKIKIAKSAADGREHILHILGPGDVFAEVVLFNQTVYPATAEVLEDACVGMIRNSDLEHVIRQNPNLALALIKILNRRLIAAQTEIRNLALHNTFARTAAMLLKLAREHGKTTGRGIELDLNISRQELAALVGTTRETVTRVLMAFKREKVIGLEGQTIIIFKPAQLESWL